MVVDYVKGSKFASIGLRLIAPTLGACVMIACWALYVCLSGVPPYILPGPDAVAAILIADWPILGPALWVTTKTTLLALLLALIGGGGIAVLLAQARWIEAAVLSCYCDPSGHADYCDCAADLDLRADTRYRATDMRVCCSLLPGHGEHATRIEKRRTLPRRSASHLWRVPISNHPLFENSVCSASFLCGAQNWRGPCACRGGGGGVFSRASREQCWFGFPAVGSAKPAQHTARLRHIGSARLPWSRNLRRDLRSVMACSSPLARKRGHQ